MIVKDSTYIILILGLACLIQACKKLEIPDPSEWGTKYELKGKMNDQPFYIGLDSLQIEMSTSATLSPHAIWITEGELHNKLTENGEWLYIGLKSPHLTSSTQLLSGLIEEGNRPLNLPEGKWTTFYPLEVEVHKGYEIRIDSLVMYSGTEHQHLHSPISYFTSKNNLKTDLHYSTSRADSCLKTSILAADQSGILPGVNWHVVGDPHANTVKLKASVKELNENDVTYLWCTGDTSNHIITSQPGRYRVTAKTGTGKEFVHDKFLYKAVDGAFHTYADYLEIHAFWHDEIKRMDSLQLGSVIIQYRDVNGDVYTLSDDQPDDAIFTINSVKNQTNDRSGKKIINTEIKFTALLRHNNKTIRLENIEGTFAFGLPH